MFVGVVPFAHFLSFLLLVLLLGSLNVAATARSNLGRMVAAGSGWGDVPMDEARAPGRRYSTSLGRALAGKRWIILMCVVRRGVVSKSFVQFI